MSLTSHNYFKQRNMNQEKIQYLRWPVREYNQPDRDRNWYIIASALAFLMIFFSFFSFSGWRLVFLGSNSNFLFALIIMMTIAIMFSNHHREPLMIDVELGPEGIKVGKNFYDYDSLKNFVVLYKPKESLKNLYFEYKSSWQPRLSIPLRRMDAITVRNFLVRYLEENLERTEAPLSEHLTKILKL